MVQQSTAPVLFESTDNIAVQQDPANEAWVALIGAIAGERFEVLARRYSQALYHFRKQCSRPALPGQVQSTAPSRQVALQAMLAEMEQRKVDRRQADGAPPPVFVDPRPDPTDETQPVSLRDFSVSPPPLSALLGGVGPRAAALGAAAQARLRRVAGAGWVRAPAVVS
jgi:hypothetical protein